MPYTYKSLALAWLITLGLFALTATGVVAGAWLILLILLALATPALILRRLENFPAAEPVLDPIRVIARSRRRPGKQSENYGRSRLDAGVTDVYRWENEGGAPQLRG